MKTCFKCDKEKPFSEFYKHKMMGDGYLNKCKECTKKDSRKHRDDNLEKVKEYDRNRPNAAERSKRFGAAHKDRMKNPDYKKNFRKKRKEWDEGYVVQKGANTIAGHAIRDGRLTKEPCEVCGELKVDAHHDDYEKPMDVRWLCRTHHAEHHKKLREKERNP